jgi:hypothetical protein
MKCPGCGGEFPDIDGPVHRYMESSAGCWAVYGEVLAREYLDPALLGIHRLTVDTYAVQHPGKPSRQSIQSVCMHLVRLKLQLERGLGPREANDAMLALGRHKREFVWLDPPASRGDLTVIEVRACPDRRQHEASVRKWARSALSAWAVHDAAIERWCEMAVA